MELHQLRYFRAVARAGSFTRAAEREKLSQPTLSHQIHKLETELGVPLFERLGRSVRLTKFGEDLLPRASQVLLCLGEARVSLDELRERLRGHIRVGVIPTIMPYFLAPRINDFTSRYPDIEIRMIEEVTPRLMEGLQAGDLDVVLASLPIPNAEIVCGELFREQILLAVSPGHRLANTGSVDLTDVRNERLVLLKDGHCFRDQVLAACTRASAHFESVFETDQFASIFPLVASGFGVTLVPEMACASALGCALIPLRKAAVRRVGFLRNRRAFHGKLVKTFTGWLREQAGK